MEIKPEIINAAATITASILPIYINQLQQDQTQQNIPETPAELAYCAEEIFKTVCIRLQFAAHKFSKMSFDNAEKWHSAITLGDAENSKKFEY